ncbi:MAG TPA: hypothetical protein VFV70_14370 [Hyphomonadaceae bacterium]|nr:hypothetical protein [Hyphomonadaceae bacterium]
MFVKIMDRAKGVAIAAGAASLLAFAGVLTLAASLAATLALWLPWPAALALTAVTFFAVAAIAMWVGVQPERIRSDDPDHDQASDAALALVDLPMEAAKRIITERPVAAIVLASGLGLLIARRPQVAMKMVDKILERFS